MKTRTSDVVIIGGGMGGLSAAIALAKAGLQVSVLETRRGQRIDHWGFTLWPPATRTLDWLGVLDEVAARGCALKALRWLGADGSEWTSVNLEPGNGLGRFIGILPSELDAVLSREAIQSGVEILEGVERWDYERARDGSFTVEAAAAGEEISLSARLIVGADGPSSPLRQRLGVRAWKWRPPGQIIMTGIGGRLAFEESRQAVGVGWSGGGVAVGAGKSWVYAISLQKDDPAVGAPIRGYGELDPEARAAVSELRDVIEISPWSWRVREWAADGILLIGDAAHCILPHLGLGGTMALEDIPVLTEVVLEALGSGDTSVATLKTFQSRRAARVNYSRRVSELWALSLTTRLPGLRYLRDYNFKRLSKHPELVDAFVRELSGTEPPSTRTRLKVWLP